MKLYSLAFLSICLFLFGARQTLEIPRLSALPDSVQTLKADKSWAANMVLKSTDNGQTWQDISEGLPENLRVDLLVEKRKVSIFKTGGVMFSDRANGLFKSADGGITWKQVYTGGSVSKVAESNGVLMATDQSGIIRSTDGGENWENVIQEGGVGIAVESIQGGFAAITYNTETKTRRVRASFDGGKSWQRIDAGLPASPLIASIVEVGENLFCGHPEGIFKSSDKGKTWKLVRPSIGNKVFNLSVSDNVLYAVPKEGGC